jgi:excisionase family DNA binding protein
MPKKIGDIRLYSVEELSELLDIQETTVRKYLREGRIRGRKLARRWYVSEESLATYFRETEPEEVE